MNTAPLIGISRLRMGTDGHGVTTLVAFHGCLLHCRYCLNRQCNTPEGVWRTMSAQEIYDEVKKDALYFKATRGGITFGGGEPLLRADFIKEILEIGAKEWHISVETSLNVAREKLEILLPYVDEYFVDIKDMNPLIYEKYTGKTNEQVISNLEYLVKEGMADKIVCRVPLIPRFNNSACQYMSVEGLKEMGLTRFDKFKYTTEKAETINIPPTTLQGVVID